MTELKKGRIHQAYYRNGHNHREGADVSFADIVSIFGFRTIEIGNLHWLKTQVAEPLHTNGFTRLTIIYAANFIP
jgi:hypothetical protein